VAFVLFFDMGMAAPRYVIVSGASMYPALKASATFAADNLARKSVSILIFITSFDDAFFCRSLLNKKPERNQSPPG
jgi:hypothetical protein